MFRRARAAVPGSPRLWPTRTRSTCQMWTLSLSELLRLLLRGHHFTAYSPQRFLLHRPMFIPATPWSVGTMSGTASVRTLVACTLDRGRKIRCGWNCGRNWVAVETDLAARARRTPVTVFRLGRRHTSTGSL